MNKMFLRVNDKHWDAFGRNTRQLEDMVGERIFTIYLRSICSSEPYECTIYGNGQLNI